MKKFITDKKYLELLERGELVEQVYKVHFETESPVEIQVYISWDHTFETPLTESEIIDEAIGYLEDCGLKNYDESNVSKIEVIYLKSQLEKGLGDKMVALTTYHGEKEVTFNVPAKWVCEQIDTSLETFLSSYTYDDTETMYNKAKNDFPYLQYVITESVVWK